MNISERILSHFGKFCRAEQMTESVWDYVFLGTAFDLSKMPIPEEKLKALRREFLYWLVYS